MKNIFSVFLLVISLFVFAQVNPNDTLRVEKLTKDSISAIKEKSEVQIISDIEKVNAPAKVMKLNPTKAGLYSAVLPGLGQLYNKKYWKIPLVWGAVGTGVGIAIWNDRQYRRYRDAFVSELNGQPHEFSGIKGVDKNVLGNVQDRSKRQRDYAIGITALIYVLNIMDAVVDAHLYEGRHDPDLAIKPAVIYDEMSNFPSKGGLTLSYRF